MKALSKPTAAAWLANQLAREHLDELESLALLGEEMREATAALDGARLRELTPKRHEQVDSLVKQAVALAGTADRKVSTDVAQKLRGDAGCGAGRPGGRAGGALRAADQRVAPCRVRGGGRVRRALERRTAGTAAVCSPAKKTTVKKAAAKDEAAERGAAKRLAEAEGARPRRSRCWMRPRPGWTI